MPGPADSPGTPQDLPALQSATRRLALRAAGELDTLARLLDRYHNAAAAEVLRGAAAEHRRQAERGAAEAAPDAEAAAEPNGGNGADIDPFLATPVDAINLVLGQTQAAFAFFRDTAAMAPDTAVRQVAEGLARDALDRVVHLRLDRRRAARAQHTAPSPLDLHLGRDVTGMADLTALADGVAAAVADMADAATLDAKGAGLTDVAALLQAFAALWRQSVRVGDAAGGPETRLPGVTTAGAAGEILHHIRPVLRAAEHATDRFAAIAAAPPDEATLWAAQTLARQAAHCAGQLRHAILVTG